MATDLGPVDIGKLEWRIQAVGTGILSDAMPVDLGTMTANFNADGSLTVDNGDDLTERLALAVAAFTAVMNA